MVEFFRTAESLEEVDAAVPAEQQFGQLGLIQKGSGYDFCCLLLAVQSNHMTARKKKTIPNIVRKAHGNPKSFTMQLAVKVQRAEKDQVPRRSLLIVARNRNSRDILRKVGM